jgi:hypothetical protein
MSTDIDDLIPGAPLLVVGKLIAVGVPKDSLDTLKKECEQHSAKINRLLALLRDSRYLIASIDSAYARNTVANIDAELKDL